jgi:hypothetical protein
VEPLPIGEDDPGARVVEREARDGGSDRELVRMKRPAQVARS